MSKVTHVIAALAAAFAIGGTLSSADAAPRDCRTVSVERVLESGTNHNGRQVRRWVTATTVKCGGDYSTSIMFGPWSRNQDGTPDSQDGS